MLPAYRSMDSYPFQRNQIPFPYYHHHHPGIEPIPPQMTMDPSKSHFPYEQPWPYANTYGHGHPIPTHFCCGHNNFPGYYGYKPYYYPPAPSPMYPSYGEPFFSPYSPQSHYTMELPRYEYDKYMPRERDHHCCGCPNHSCNQKEGKSVKIVEQDPDVGKKEKDDVVPVQLRNYPYPLGLDSTRALWKLKKLKQIAEVSKEVANVRGSVQAFEGSPDVQNDEKQKIAIGETIMRLLLKLDTMQGLHPSLRETRKSLARELVTLQERLDSMMVNRPQQQMQQLNVQESVEVSPLNMGNGEHHQEQQEEKQEEKLDATREDSSKGINDSSDDTLEKHQDQLHMKDGDNNLPLNDGESESKSLVVLPSNEREDHSELPNGLVEEDISSMVSVDALDTTKAAESEARSELNDILPIEVEQPDMTALKELPVGVIDEDMTSFDSENNKKDELDSDINAMMELPVGVLDEDAATYEFGKKDETDISKDEAEAGNEGFIEELPVGLLDEDTEKSEVVPAKGEERNSNEIAGSSTDDTARDTQVEQSLLEEQVEVESSGDSDGWVKVEFQKEDENVTKLPCLAEQVSGPHQGNEELCLESNGVSDILQEPIEFMPQVEENLAQKETKVDGQEEMVARDALANEDNELSDDLLVAKHDEGNGDMKLLEENEKLRKLMKELLQAGNEQLSVISNLTGRVKDLEKKLAKSKRSKKVKTKKNRRLTSKISHSNSDE